MRHFSFFLAPMVTLTSLDRSPRSCYLLSSSTYLLRLGSTVQYRGTQVVTLLMPYDIHSQFSSSTSDSTTFDASATWVEAIPHPPLLVFVNATTDWASIAWVFTTEEDPRHSPSTTSNLTTHLSSSAKTQSELGTLAVFGPETGVSRHITTSIRAIYQDTSAISTLSELRLPEQKKTKKKLKKWATRRQRDWAPQRWVRAIKNNHQKNWKNEWRGGKGIGHPGVESEQEKTITKKAVQDKWSHLAHITSQHLVYPRRFTILLTFL